MRRDWDLRLPDVVLYAAPLLLALFCLVLSQANDVVFWGFEEDEPATPLSTLLIFATLLIALAGVRRPESIDHGPPTGDDYPIDDQLVYFHHAFEILETRVEGWKAVEPPAELVEEHRRLVAAMEEVQAIVLDYAQHAALEDSEFSIDQVAVDAEVVASSAVWRRACRDLSNGAILLEVPIAFAGNCAVPTLTD